MRLDPRDIPPSLPPPLRDLKKVLALTPRCRPSIIQDADSLVPRPPSQEKGGLLDRGCRHYILHK